MKQVTVFAYSSLMILQVCSILEGVVSSEAISLANMAVTETLMGIQPSQAAEAVCYFLLTIAARNRRRPI